MPLLPVSLGGRALAGALVLVAGVLVTAAALGAVTADASVSLLAAALVGALLAAALALFAQRSVARPLDALALAADSLSTAPGDIDVGGPEEVVRLAAALRRAAAAMRAESAAGETERHRLSQLIDELRDAILIADASGRVVLANLAAREVAGADAVGRSLPEVIRDHEVLDAIAGARRGQETAATVERAEPRRFARAVARPLGDGLILLVVQDLTALRRLETVRSDFVANVSHELRRPIASLKAMVEALESGALTDPDAARDFVQRMHQEVDGLTQLTHELLTLSRIESGADSLTLSRQLPADLMNESARRMGPLAVRAQVTLVVERTRAPAVRADGDRVATVLANLVHNAVKFTPAGGTVRLSAERVDGEVVFSVTDTGIGLEPREVERVFERFYKADPSRSSGGTGLGLAIAKHIVQAHGGRIDASSDGPGRGATFRFTLPVA